MECVKGLRLVGLGRVCVQVERKVKNRAGSPPIHPPLEVLVPLATSFATPASKQTWTLCTPDMSQTVRYSFKLEHYKCRHVR